MLKVISKLDNLQHLKGLWWFACPGTETLGGGEDVEGCEGV